MCPARRKRTVAPPIAMASPGAAAFSSGSTARAASSSYSGSAGLCFEKPWRFANRASSSWMCPLSGSKIPARSHVARVACTRPRKPFLTSKGR